MKGFATLFLIFSTQAFGMNWYCKDVASERSANIIRACGVGMGADENEARTKAFENAKNEFTNICSNSDDCKNRRVTITPQRTACETEGPKHKCYRLIEFTILEQIGLGKEHTGLEVYKTTSMPSKIDKAEMIKPFYYEETEKYPKIWQGMTKKELLENFGAPTDVNKDSNNRLEVKYLCIDVKFCSRGETYAFVSIDANDMVRSFNNFNYNYTELLKPRQTGIAMSCQGNSDCSNGMSCSSGRCKNLGLFGKFLGN